MGVARALEDKVPYGPYPPPAGRVRHDEIGALQLRLHGPVVELPEEFADHRLLPDLVPVQVPHHAPEPGAAAPARAEDPDYVLGIGGRITAPEPRPQPPGLGGDLTVLALQPAITLLERPALRGGPA